MRTQQDLRAELQHFQHLFIVVSKISEGVYKKRGRVKVDSAGNYRSIQYVQYCFDQLIVTQIFALYYPLPPKYSTLIIFNFKIEYNEFKKILRKQYKMTEKDKQYIFHSLDVHKQKTISFEQIMAVNAYYHIANSVTYVII